jgi:serine/threonine protein kinase
MSPLAPGIRLGPYEIVAPLGAGGMGEVYRASDARLNRDVAVKILPEAFAQAADRRARFEREAQTIAALSHPNILAIFDTGLSDGHLYVVTELLRGGTLRERLVGGPLPVRKAVDVGAQVARGLAAAHERGLVHRDLKPENIFC